MLLSDFFELIRLFLSLKLAPMALAAFSLVATSVLAYKFVASRFHDPLWIAGVFLLAFVCAAQSVEPYDGLSSWLCAALLVGVGRVCYERLLGER